MAKPRFKRIRHILEYAAVLMFLTPLRLLPFTWRSRFGGSLLGFLIRHMPKFRRRVMVNLQRIFPELPAADKNLIAMQVSQNFGRTFVELFSNRSYCQQTDFFHLNGDFPEGINTARQKGKGAILISGHFGQWEAIRHFCNKNGTPVGAVYKPSHNPHFDKIFRTNLAYGNAPVFPSGAKGMSDLMRYVRNGGVVAILIDQNAKRAEPFDFLGQGAPTSTVAAKIAVKFNIPIIPVYGIRRNNSPHIDITFEPPIPISTPEKMTQALNHSLETRVRANPGQWFWLHWRWGRPK